MAKKLVRGWGINDADYPVTIHEKLNARGAPYKQKLIWMCPFYRRWSGMLDRCYSPKFHERQPTYKGCFVAEEWRYFSVFREWMSTQEWEDKALDKDILIPNNKKYGPDTCIFVSHRVNCFIADVKSRGDFLPGASYDGRQPLEKPWMGRGMDIADRYIHLGMFATEVEAHEAWLKNKLYCARLIGEQVGDKRLADALIKRYENFHKYFDLNRKLNEYSGN